MTSVIITVLGRGPGLTLPGDPEVCGISNRGNTQTPCHLYEFARASYPADIQIYLHDDVTVYDPEWLPKLLQPFQDHPDCVAVGMGGATSLGNADLYRKPFNIWNMARGGYASNQTDAETHGARFSGVRRVAVLDAFCMAVRADFLSRVGGWPVDHITHHCLDLWLACEAARHGKEIWMSGISVLHSGGGTSTKKSYSDARWLQGGTMEQDHIRPHRWLWDTYRDVLPIFIP